MGENKDKCGYYAVKVACMRELVHVLTAYREKTTQVYWKDMKV